ncbi:ABC transporter permease [Winogradskyella aurantia]|uniref:ABC transporter permease n=1 Tax=Winogradskyella aurantia TaxID=1915063 RepID=A0A265UWJ8_9FLAO|nr:ABC transporter permease [Winogradskyella aurantia]OZV69680.1 ABC transporter permease [Winogradskyella aurantia]
MFSLFRENVKIAITSIRSQLLRTILTVIIIAIGIMALVGILSGIAALENTISGNFSSMGANTFRIQRYEFSIMQQSSRRQRKKINPEITYTEAQEFIDRYNYPFTMVSLGFPAGRGDTEVKYENRKTEPEVGVLGCNEYFLETEGRDIELGRGLNVFDIQNNNAVCVIGSDLKKALFPDEYPINRTVSIRGAKLKVIGVVEEQSSAFGSNQNMILYLPIQKARTIYTESSSDYRIGIKVAKKDMLEGAQDDAMVTFRNVRRLKPLEENNFGITRSDDLINRISSISGYLYVAAWIISIITIFGSTIALMNIMLVSVTERTREIGVRKAMGAKRKTIAFQFFIETMIIGQLGGLLGIILGVAIGWGISKAFDLSFSTPWLAMIWATSIAFVVALISGVYPANKAAKLDPIEALRHE